MNHSPINNLRGIAQFTLFISSYAPLLFLIIIKQVSTNSDFLQWGGIHKESIVLFLQKFGLAAFLGLLLLLGLIGYKLTFRNLEQNAANGELVWLRDVKNKNSEAIGYIATYIIPFLFQDFETLYEIFAVLFLLYIIYRIYINSTMLLINPILSMKYALYEVEYEVKGKKFNGLMVSREKYLKEDTTVKLYEIGHKLFYLTQNK